MGARAFIAGIAGTVLTDRERAFFRESEPWGLIVFKRNINTPDQVRRLTDSFREAVGRADAPVLVDQEGGRVQRLGPPHWPSYPAGAVYGRLYRRDRAAGLTAARLGARLGGPASGPTRSTLRRHAGILPACLRAKVRRWRHHELR